jgi:hypothetical protein
MLPPGRRPGVDPLNVALLTGAARLTEADNVQAVWPTLSAAEKVAVLSDAHALDQVFAAYGAGEKRVRAGVAR